jgi:hypothetical protein
MSKSTEYNIRVEEVHPSTLDDDDGNNRDDNKLDRHARAMLDIMRAEEEEARRQHRKLPRWHGDGMGWWRA